MAEWREVEAAVEAISAVETFCVESLLFLPLISCNKKAPSAHASRFGRCTNGVDQGSGVSGRKFIAAGKQVFDPLSVKRQVRYCVM